MPRSKPLWPGMAERSGSAGTEERLWVEGNRDLIGNSSLINVVRDSNKLPDNGPHAQGVNAARARRSSSTRARATGTWSATTSRCSSCATASSSPTWSTRSSPTPRTTSRRTGASPTSSPTSPSPCTWCGAAALPAVRPWGPLTTVLYCLQPAALMCPIPGPRALCPLHCCSDVSAPHVAWRSKCQ